MKKDALKALLVPSLFEITLLKATIKMNMPGTCDRQMEMNPYASLIPFSSVVADILGCFPIFPFFMLNIKLCTSPPAENVLECGIWS